LLNQSILFANFSDVYLKFKKIKWPRIEKPSPGSITLTVVSATKKTIASYKYSNLISATPLRFSKIGLVMDKKSRGDIDCRYTFSFETATGIPSGGTLQLSFPSQYNLILSDPAVRVSYPDFVDESADLMLSHFYTANKLKISNIGELPAGSAFRIIFNGLRNPSFDGIMSNFFIDTQYQEYSLSRQENFISISLDKPGEPGYLKLVTFEAFPMNADASADYTFILQPGTKLSIGTEIAIRFPEQYKVIPTILDCEISGGISTFDSCYPSFNDVVLRLNVDYEISQGPFQIIIRSILNPDQGETDAFEIIAKYDSGIIELTDPTLTNDRKLNIVQKASTIKIISTDIDPQNEAELSTYSITFLPTNNIEVLQEILFIFPKTFDQQLGFKIECAATSGIASKISCTKLVDRKLYIAGIDSYEVSEERPITIEISGIINPNILSSTNTKGISIAIKRQGSNSFIDYIDGAVTISPLNAPGWAFFYSINASNTNCRYTADYSVNFTASSSIPKLSSKGAIILDLPKQFEIQKKIVTAVSYSSVFGKALNCEIISNRVWITGNTNDFSGNLLLKVKQVDNPIDEVSTDNLVIRTYDGVNKKVIERSFENLDPFYKSYQYPGPLIIINNDEPIIVAKGTQSGDIPIYIEGIAALNLTLVPDTPGFQILPFNIPIQIGELYSYFRISVAKDFTDGEYQVNWTIKGELIPPIYTPIKPIIVKVIKLSEVIIQVDTISPIPFAGTSLPVFFKVDRAPDIGFAVQANLKKNYQGVNISTNVLEFPSGVSEKYFRIYFSDRDAAATEGLVQGAIDLQLIGVNQDLYKLPFSTIFFNIVPQDVIPPTVNTMTQGSVGKTFVNYTIVTSEPCYVFYMTALKGSRVPTRKELENEGPPSDVSTLSKYGRVFTFENLTSQIFVTGLEPQLEYVLYVILVDTGDKSSELTYNYTFSTKDRENAADVSIRLKQSFVSPYDTRIALEMIALVLSLEKSKVIASKYSFNDKKDTLGDAGRLLQEGEGIEKFTEFSVEGGTKITQITTLISFNIISVIESELYPTPKELGEKLNSKKIELAARIPNFDSSYSIPSTEFIKYYPNFVTPPILTRYTWENATFSVRLNNYGWVYAVAIAKNISGAIANELTTTTSTNVVRSSLPPSALQISLGLDSENMRVPAVKVEVEVKYQYYTLTILNLTELTGYSIFVIGGNAHPGYPDLMQDKFISKLEFNTPESPKRNCCKINKS